MSAQLLNVVEAPERAPVISTPTVFLAGGISNCPVWQDVVIEKLAKQPATVFNPRRAVWPDEDQFLAEQIEWERDHIERACLRAFWFPSETECPITLLELGYSLAAKLPIVVGCHPDYSRKLDVQIQTQLSDPSISIVESLDRLVGKICDFINNQPEQSKANDD